MDEIKRDCPTFGDKVCPFAKLAVKGAAGNCPAFEKGCPFAKCTTVGAFEDKLGQMRTSHKNSPSGNATSLLYLREIHRAAKDKEVDIGSACPFFQTKGGCPFAKDTSGKAIFSPDYIVVSFIYDSMNDILVNNFVRYLTKVAVKFLSRNNLVTSANLSLCL